METEQRKKFKKRTLFCNCNSDNFTIQKKTSYAISPSYFMMDFFKNQV